MARLLRLHLSCVGHKDARFFPLKLDFRDRGGAPTDCVIWLVNGGGKSSLMNLFYSCFLPESRKFLGTKPDHRERKLTDYIKSNDLAVVISEWQMPTGPHLFSATRIVGQVLSWKGGIATPEEESRLDREFFTFRGSGTMPFDSLPLHGLNPQPLTNIGKVREWLADLAAQHPELEVERGDQSNKSKWRETLDRVGIDTELFNYHLKMNVREGGAAELFKVKDTMQFVDLFLEMALNTEHADKTKEQIEAVREKLLRLPQKECEERFTLALLGELRPLAHEAAAATLSEEAWRERRRANFLLQTAIENSISLAKARLAVLEGELILTRRDRDDAVAGKKARQEYRLNYHNLARELTFREAQQALEVAKDALEGAGFRKRLAAAASSFARISARQRIYDELVRQRDAELIEQKPLLDELHTLGATFAAAIAADLVRINALFAAAEAAQSLSAADHLKAVARLNELRGEHTRTETELENVKRRLVVRDQRRTSLRHDGHLLPDEKAAGALVRAQDEAERTENAISAAEARIEKVDEALQITVDQLNGLALQRRNLDQEATGRDSLWRKGDADARILQGRAPIREVLGTDSPELNFPDLLSLLDGRQKQLENEFVQGRADCADDERTVHSFEIERLFPPTREVELVIAHLRDRGVKTALPAYRFLAMNATIDGAARQWLAHEPARFSGIVVTSEAEFLGLQPGAFVVPGLRHPVQVTLSANPDETLSGNGMTVALPSGEGAFNYDAAMRDRGAVEDRLAKSNERLASIAARKQETIDVRQELVSWQTAFGGGTLDRLAAERDQLREELGRVDEEAAKIGGSDAALRAERTLKVAEIKALRPQVTSLTLRQERLRGYIEEYEQHETAWIEDRREKITLLDHLGGHIAIQEREVCRLADDLEARKQRVRELTAEQQDRQNRQQGIRFHNAPSPQDVPTLETAETRYVAAMARFDERFGRSELEGQIKQADSYLVELRDEHREISGGLTDDEIAMAAENPDLSGQQQEAERQHLRAYSAHSDAVTALTAAELDRPDVPAHKQGLGLPPGQPRPSTAAEAVALREALDVTIEQDSTRIAELGAEISGKENEEQALKATVGARIPHLTTLEDLTDAASGPTPSLPTDDAAIAQLVADAKRQTQALARAHDAAQRIVDDRIQRLRTTTRRDEFATIPVIARDRLASLPREELLQRCSEFIQSHEAWQKVLRNEIETLGKDKDLVVRALDGVADSATRLLGKAQAASIMPDAFPGWTGQPFLRITAQPITEPAARRDRLATLVARLVNEKAIPTGHELASRALREVGGPIRATLLKPEDPLRPDRHDITEFGTFSGGEKMTAAILLYATLAQLRIRGRDEHTRERKAGVLLLDNPFGTASKRELVELQLRVARQMGVQLIYTTGVNDLGALDVLPRILRLRKRHRDRRSGDLLLSQDAPEEHIEGVQANLRS